MNLVDVACKWSHTIKTEYASMFLKLWSVQFRHMARSPYGIIQHGIYKIISIEANSDKLLFNFFCFKPEVRKKYDWNCDYNLSPIRKSESNCVLLKAMGNVMIPERSASAPRAQVKVRSWNNTGLHDSDNCNIVPVSSQFYFILNFSSSK